MIIKRYDYHTFGTPGGKALLHLFHDCGLPCGFDK